MTPPDGSSTAGAWSFKVVDQAGADFGTIDSWTLTPTFASDTCPAPTAPPSVPDGSVGSAMTASLTSATGSAMRLDWDVGTCTATNYHILYGPMGGVSAYAIAGGVCGLGTSGSYTWSGVPSGDLWFVVVSDDGVHTEGSWGRDGSGADLGGTTASAQCGYTARDNTATCP